MPNWVTEFDISKLTPETKRLLIQFSDTAPEADLSTKEKHILVQNPFTGENETYMETHTVETEETRKWFKAREALMSCPEPELRVHADKLNYDLCSTELVEFRDANPNDLDSQKAKESEIIERLKDLEHDLHKLGLRIKDNK